jgi:hypothetical protein
MKNLTIELQDIYNAKERNEKLALCKTLIEQSHAKATTKRLAYFQIEKLGADALDKYMTNYVLSGEGMKV